MSSSTAARLRAATEDLLLEQGQSATTLRDITDRAGANVAAVGYHFGSKDALVAQVYTDALREVSEVQRDRLAALPEQAPLEDLVRVWLAPALDPAGPGSREARLWGLIQRGMVERSPGLLENVDAVHDVVDTHLVARLAAALPHLGREELALRHAAVLGAVGAVAAGGLAPVAGPLPAAAVDMLVAWVVGGLRAPAAERTG